MARKREVLELALTRITDENGKRKFLMRNDSVTYELRRYDLSEVTQKFLFGIMYKISANFLEPSNIIRSFDDNSFQYKIDVSELKSLVNIDYNIEFHQDKVDKLFKELVNTPIAIRVNNEKGKSEKSIYTNLIEKVIFDKNKDFFNIRIAEESLPFFKAVSGRYSIWGFEYITFTEKKYTPRLFELLVSFAKSIGDNNYKGKISKTYEIDELRYELKIPDSYKYLDIKRHILESCKTELLATDIGDGASNFKLFKSFDYIPVELNINKKGRKAIGSITFTFELTDLTISRFKGEIFDTNLKSEVEGKMIEVSLQEAITTLAYWLETTDNKCLSNLSNDFIDKAYQMIANVKNELNLSIIDDKILIETFKYFTKTSNSINEDIALNYLKECLERNIKWFSKK